MVTVHQNCSLTVLFIMAAVYQKLLFTGYCCSTHHCSLRGHMASVGSAAPARWSSLVARCLAALIYVDMHHRSRMKYSEYTSNSSVYIAHQYNKGSDPGASVRMRYRAIRCSSTNMTFRQRAR